MLKVRLNEVLNAFVATQVGEDRPYNNAGEYVRDLIRRDKGRAEAERFKMLKAELQHASQTPLTRH
jgi:Arc/MetJ-type ribon-helix-helix transcriptional regulator